MADVPVLSISRSTSIADETGHSWTWLTDAQGLSVIQPGSIVVVGDEDALAMGRIVDLVDEEKGTVVHVDVLPGPVGSDVEAVNRFAATD